MAAKLLRWLIFSVAIGLLPIIFNYLSLVTKHRQLDLGQLIGRGELLLISAALCAAAVGELFGSGASYKVLKILSGGSAILLLTLTSLYFADISAVLLLQTSQERLDLEMVKFVSIWVFIFSTVTSASCIILAEV